MTNKQERSKSNIREFFNLRDIQESEFDLPPEIVEKICSHVSIDEEVIHSFRCPYNPINQPIKDIDSKFRMDFSNLIIENDVVVSRWYIEHNDLNISTSCYKEPTSSIIIKPMEMDFISLTNLTIREDVPLSKSEAIMWYPEWHQHQEEIRLDAIGELNHY